MTDQRPIYRFSSVSDVLLAHRRGKGQRELAREIGCSPTTVLRILRGDAPDPKTSDKILEWAGYEMCFVRKHPTTPRDGFHTKVAHSGTLQDWIDARVARQGNC
jgi:transcriptional regulator with XRE-family HTH domain